MWLSGNVTCPNQVRSSLGEVGEYIEDNGPGKSVDPLAQVLVQAPLQVVLWSEPIARAGSVDIMVERGSCFSSSEILGTRLGRGHSEIVTGWGRGHSEIFIGCGFPYITRLGDLCSVSSSVWNKSELHEEGPESPGAGETSCLPSPGKIASQALKT